MKFLIFLIIMGLLVPAATNAAIADELVAVARAGNVAVVKLSSGKHSGPQIWTLKPFQARVSMRVDEEKTSSKPALSRDGKWVAWGCKDGTLRVFSAGNGSLRARLGHAYEYPLESGDYPYEVRALAFSPDGQKLAWANSKGVFVGDWRRRKLLYSRPLPTYNQDRETWHSLQQAVVLSFSRDGRYLAVAGQSATGTSDQENAHIFVLESGGGLLRRHWIMDCGDGEPVALRFSPRADALLVVSEWIVSGSDFDKADLFSVRSGEQIWHHDNQGIYTEYSIGTGSDRFPQFAAFSDDGTRVAIGGSGATRGDENFLEIRRASDGKVLSLIHKPNDVLPLADQMKLRPELNFH